MCYTRYTSAKREATSPVFAFIPTPSSNPPLRQLASLVCLASLVSQVCQACPLNLGRLFSHPQDTQSTYKYIPGLPSSHCRRCSVHRNSSTILSLAAAEARLRSSSHVPAEQDLVVVEEDLV